MSFHFSFIAKDKTRALTHLANLQLGAYHNVPEPVWSLAHAALEGIRQAGAVSVTATGHLVTADPES